MEAKQRARAFIAMITDGVTAGPGDIKELPAHVVREIELDQPAPLADTYLRQPPRTQPRPLQ